MSHATSEIRLSGLALSDGIAVGQTHLVQAPGVDMVPYYAVPETGIDAERARLDAALVIARQELGGLMDRVSDRIGQAHASIFAAQQAMLSDPVLLNEMHQAIADQRINADAAVDHVLDRYERQLQALDNRFFADRASDVSDLRRQVLLGLAQSSEAVPSEVREAPERSILVASELTPSETVGLDTAKILGFVTEHGGPASHAAILARALGVPAVSGVGGIQRLVDSHTELLVDGTSGEVIVRPSNRTLKLYPRSRHRGPERRSKVPPVPGFPVHANISLSSEVDEAVRMDAEGIGLYRTEYEFLSAARVLDEDEQTERYAHVVRAMGGRPVTVRLLDFGADKSAGFLGIAEEENPCLGFRGARLLLKRTDLLIPQARAVARASKYGPVNILYPMVADHTQFLKLREIVRQYIADIPGTQVQHGVMFEVPSACIEAETLLEVAEFGSIGSNDLLQYLFAIDRNNELVADDYQADHPVFWSVVERLATAAERQKRPLSLCGEVGGQAATLPKLLAVGIRSVSVSPRLIGLARMAARRSLYPYERSYLNSSNRSYYR